MVNKVFQNQLKKLPNKPGVYLFKSAAGQILYVGRATSLKQRVSSYRQKLLDPRLGELVSKIKKIKTIKTETILEAVILEANLIKKYWPKYNIKDRDNRSFIYIVIPHIAWTYPKIVRQRELVKFLPKSADIFGPYQSLSLVKSFLRIIRRVFPYSTCQPLSGRACFNYQIGLCPGACVNKIGLTDYQKNIKNIILLLSGRRKLLLKKLARQNPEQARALKHLQDVILLHQEEVTSGQLKSYTRIEGYDISHLTGKETVGSMVVFMNGEPDKTQYRLFKIKQAPANDDLRCLAEVLTRRFKHLEWRWPDFVLVDGGRPQVDFVNKLFQKNNLRLPLVGISKFAGDKLVFPKGTKKELQELILLSKSVFLRVREEAHRFALSFSRRQRRIG